MCSSGNYSPLIIMSSKGIMLSIGSCLFLLGLVDMLLRIGVGFAGNNVGVTAGSIQSR